MKIFHNDNGQAMVEFAVFLTVMVLILSGIADYALYIHQEIELSEAAAAGAAVGVLPGQAKGQSNMQAIAQASCPDVQNLTVTATYFYTCTPGGAQVSSGTTCAGYGTPIMYENVVATATVPAALKWTGISSSLALRGVATYRVPWTL